MQFSDTAKPPRGIVYDSAFGETIDTILALGLLHGFAGKGQARIASLTISKSNLKAAQLCAAVEKFYASAITGPMAIYYTPPPIGLALDGHLAADTPSLRTLGLKPAYSNPTIKKPTDTAIAEVLMRNALTAQYDGNGVIVVAGPATNAVRMLSLKGTRDLIATKSTMLVWAAGSLTGDCPYISADPVSAKRLLAEWPVPVVIAPRELGLAIKYPADSIEKDYAYNPDHPIADAYRLCGTMPYDAPTQAMAAIAHAIKPDEAWFTPSPTGAASMTDTGRLSFKEGPGTHRVLSLNETSKESLLTLYREYTSAKPVMRFPRRRPDPVKPPEQKKEKS